MYFIVDRENKFIGFDGARKEWPMTHDGYRTIKQAYEAQKRLGFVNGLCELTEDLRIVCLRGSEEC